MPNGELLQELWNLRANPFAPVVDVEGQPLDVQEVFRSLDPRSDPRLLRYYFDLYDWGAETGVRLTAERGLEGFSALNGLSVDQSSLVLIWGKGETGRRSLKNLVFYEAARVLDVSGLSPIFVEANLGGHRKASALRALALLVADRVRRALSDDIAEHLQQIIADATTQADDPNAWATAFQRIQGHFMETNHRLLVHVQGGDHSDTWQLIYDCVRGVASIVVLTTAIESQAVSFRNAMGRKAKPLSVVGSSPLNLEQTRRFLSIRLSMYRMGSGALDPLPETAPFSEGAIDALFERGSGAKPDQEVRWSVRWLSDTLRSAIDTHLRNLSVGEVNVENARAALINAETLRRYREDQNAGR